MNHKNIAIVVSQFNKPITESMFAGALQTLQEAGYSSESICRIETPGAFELPLAALEAAESHKFAAVICLGCVIKGDTPHFDYVCSACTNGVMEVNMKTKIPTIFGVLTTIDEEQALLRSGLKKHPHKAASIKITVENKGIDAAQAALQMLSVQKSIHDFKGV